MANQCSERKQRIDAFVPFSVRFQYFKTVVINSAMVTIDRDIFCTRPLGGNGRASWDPNNTVHTNAYRTNQMSTASCFWTFAQQKNANCHWWQSLTGMLPSNMPGDAVVADKIAWDGCAGFASHWGYSAGGADHSLHLPFKWRTSILDRKYNVICIQDFQMKYDPTENKFCDVVLNQVSRVTRSIAGGGGRPMTLTVCCSV